MTPRDLRLMAEQYDQQAIELALAGDPEAGARRMLDAQKLRRMADEAERLGKRGLTGTNRKSTVPTSMAGAAAASAEWRKPPTLRELATMLGCTHGFLSQARAGTTRIRLSWAEKIAAVRPDLPATKKTWPKGWAPESDQG